MVSAGWLAKAFLGPLDSDGGKSKHGKVLGYMEIVMSAKDAKSEWGMFLIPPALPTDRDKLFSTAEDYWNNACLNLLPDGWALYVTGYKDAADILVSEVEAHGHYHDTLVYPIIFLYRQYLELAIKDLIRQARKLQDVHEPFPKTHRIDELWNICSALLQKISPGDSETEQKNIGRLIDEFCDIDPTSMAFRYPEDREGSPSLPGIAHINLRNVKEVMAKIAIILDGADAQIDHYLSIKADIYSGSY